MITEESPTDLTVAILAGGESIRMGMDKSRLLYAWDITWLEHLERLASSLSKNVFLLTGRNIRYQDLRFSATTRVMPDELPSEGPLSGIYTALRQCSTKRLLVLTCDMPDCSKEGLVQFLGYKNPIQFAEHSFFPISIEVSAIVISILHRRLQSHQLRVEDYLKEIGGVSVQLPTSIVNINTPSALAEWETSRT